MKRWMLLGVVVAMLIAQAVRLELAAKEPAGEATVESVKQKAKELKGRLEKLKEQAGELKTERETLKAEVEKKLEELKTLAKAPEQLGEETKRRAELLKSGDEAKQLSALDKADTLGDEGILLCGFAAKESAHAAVRRKALEVGIGLGTSGLPVLAHSFESLPTADRIYAVQQLAKQDTTATMLVLGLIVRDADDDLLEAILDAAFKNKRVLTFVAALVKDARAELVDKMIIRAGNLRDDDGLALLFAAAGSGEPRHRIAAIRTAAQRGAVGLPVVAAAYESKDADVRGEVVRAVLKIGGPVAKFVIEEALKDNDETLRKAAERVVEQEKAGK